MLFLGVAFSIISRGDRGKLIRGQVDTVLFKRWGACAGLSTCQTLFLLVLSVLTRVVGEIAVTTKKLSK
jgi:hypothetical protein